MAENFGAAKSSAPLREIVRKRRALWWGGGAVLLIALVELTWLERKRIHFPSDWFGLFTLGAGALLAVAILWKVPQWQVGHVTRLDAKERFDRVNEARKTLATILGGNCVPTPLGAPNSATIQEQFHAHKYKRWDFAQDATAVVGEAITNRRTVPLLFEICRGLPDLF